ncbi:hypothetical protein H310_02109 [Aphanomyces invadans]|uniref:Methyltransferase domain-containing protein n=1 Tax=Aphanomyces invadans TaxID=157072 RepID=A0A024UP62_9STRA|nr:hypothetical protein H310_02109 [Aphanomyces invadans]ETW07642.1 hypothetical protein H310_02109 [Aphanomyces invadans]|eukprot:XP_008863735.1 hypothetical protein H310_02109 [Aphanomyces invadans]
MAGHKQDEFVHSTGLKQSVKGPLQLDDLVEVARRLNALVHEANDDACSTVSSIASSTEQSDFLIRQEDDIIDSDVFSEPSITNLLGVPSTSHSSYGIESIDDGDFTRDNMSSSAISTIASSISSPSDSSSDNSVDVHAASTVHLSSSVLGVFSIDPRLPRRRRRRSLSSFGLHIESSSSDSDHSSDDSTTRYRRKCIRLDCLVQAKDHQRHASMVNQLSPLDSPERMQLLTESHPFPQTTTHQDEDDSVLYPSASLTAATTRPCPHSILSSTTTSMAHLPWNGPPIFCIPGTTAAKSSSASEWYMSFSTSQLPAIMEQYVPKHAKVVDVGCGRSGLCHELVLAGYSNVTGIDTDADAIASQSTRRSLLEPYLTFQTVDARHLDTTFGAHSVDCIVAKATLDLVRPPERLGILTACLAVLRPGGVLLWVSCQVDSTVSRWWDEPAIQSLLATHVDSVCTQLLGPVVGPCFGHAPGFVANVYRAKETLPQRMARHVAEETQLFEQRLVYQCAVYRRQLVEMDHEVDVAITREGRRMYVEDWRAHILRQWSYAAHNEELIEAYTVVADEEARVAECGAMAVQDAHALQLHVVWTALDVVDSIVCAVEAAHTKSLAAFAQERADLVTSEVWRLVESAIAKSDATRAQLGAFQSFIAHLLDEILQAVTRSAAGKEWACPPATREEHGDGLDKTDSTPPQLSSQDVGIPVKRVERCEATKSRTEFVPSQDSAASTVSMKAGGDADDASQVKAFVVALVDRVATAAAVPQPKTAASEATALNEGDTAAEVLAVVEALVQAAMNR